MEKRNSENLQYIDRSGKYSDRISRRGYLPEKIISFELESDAKAQLKTLEGEARNLREKLTAIRNELKVTLPYPKFVQLSAESKSIGLRIDEIQQIAGSINKDLKLRRQDKLATIFMQIAADRLPEDTFKILYQEAAAMMDPKPEPLLSQRVSVGFNDIEKRSKF